MYFLLDGITEVENVAFYFKEKINALLFYAVLPFYLKQTFY